MDQFISQYGMFLMLGILLIAMMWFSNRSRRKAMEQQEERERRMREELVPGAWVKTAVGFWGRFVDEDGDVVVLETVDGTEMYWDRQMIREIGVEPPFASDEAESEVEAAAEEPTILGLDGPETPADGTPAESDQKN